MSNMLLQLQHWRILELFYYITMTGQDQSHLFGNSVAWRCTTWAIKGDGMLAGFCYDQGMYASCVWCCKLYAYLHFKTAVRKIRFSHSFCDRRIRLLSWTMCGILLQPSYVFAINFCCYGAGDKCLTAACPFACFLHIPDVCDPFGEIVNGCTE